MKPVLCTWFPLCVTCPADFIGNNLRSTLNTWTYKLQLLAGKVLVFLGGLVVSVLATVLKVRTFKPGRSILRAIKIRSMPSFWGEVKLSAARCKILWHVKETYNVWTQTLRKAKFNISFATSSFFSKTRLLAGLPESSGGLIRSLTCRYHSTMILNGHITWG
jgi:hypothetical protein